MCPLLVCIHPPIELQLAEVKEKFYDDLQAVISSVPSSDVLLVMGDFNARVGCVSNSASESLWDGVQGNFGVVLVSHIARPYFFAWRLLIGNYKSLLQKKALISQVEK